MKLTNMMIKRQRKRSTFHMKSNERIEKKYYLKIKSKVLKKLREDLVKRIFPKIKKIVEENKKLEAKVKTDSVQKLDKSYGEKITKTFNDVAVKYKRKFERDEWLQKLAEEAEKHHLGQARKQTYTLIGVNPVYKDPILEEKRNAFVEQNVSLIKSIPEKFLDETENIVRAMVEQGRATTAIRNELIRKFKATKKRAQLIARDQVNKYHGKLTEVRQQEIGIDKYVWRTARDERVRGKPSGLYPNARPRHDILEGEVFTWSGKESIPYVDKKAGINSKGGKKKPRGLNPGMDYQCFTSDTKFFSFINQEKLYRRFYNGKMTEIISSQGKVFRCTPNHPILTKRGFLPAKQVKIGEEIVKISDQLLDGLKGYPINGNISFDQFYRFFSIFALNERVASKAEDFHSDGIVDKEIDIICIKSLLHGTSKIVFDKKVLQDFFTFADIRLSYLFPFTDFFYMRDCFGFIPTNFISLFGKLASFLCGQFGKTDDISLRTITDLNSVIDQMPFDNHMIRFIFGSQFEQRRSVEILFDNSFLRKLFVIMRFAFMPNDFIASIPNSYRKIIDCNAELLGDFTKIKSGLVEFDKVVNHSFIDFSSYVYNLETSNNWYLVNDSIIHNCRCIAMPIFDVK